MSFVSPMGQSNAQLSSALKRLSAAKYGQPRAVVEKAIFTRLGAADAEKKAKTDALKKLQQERMTGMAPASGSSGSSFLDEWLAKRQTLGAQKSVSVAPAAPSPFGPPAQVNMPKPAGLQVTPPAIAPLSSSEPTVVAQAPVDAFLQPVAPAPTSLHLRGGDDGNKDDEISIKLR